MNKKYFNIVTILFVIIWLSTLGLKGRLFNYATQVLPNLYFMAMFGPVFAGNIRKSAKSAWRIAFIFWILFFLVLLGLSTLQFVSGTETKFIQKWGLATYVAYLSLWLVLYLKSSKREKTK